MTWRIRVAAMATAMLAVFAAPASAQPADTAVAHLREELAGGPPSSYALVSADGKVTTGAVGPDVTPQSPFLLGSLSKSFTATAVMQLVDAGKVGLDTPITAYLPWFRTAGSNDPITVRQLLNQTSGLPTEAGTVDLYEPETTLEQRVRALADVVPVSRPGTAFHYCNKNYATLGLLVEQVSGQSYADYLKAHVLAPLGMNRTFTNLADARRAGLIEGSSVLFGLNVPMETPDFPGALPDGYLVSTAEDLSHYLTFQMTGAYRGVGPLSAESLRLMHSAAVPTGDDHAIDGIDHYGSGWGTGTLHGQPVVQHDGDLTRYHANLGFLPNQQVGLVVLTSRNPVLLDNGAPFHHTLAMLAGAPAPEIGNGFLLTYGVIDGVALLALAAMVLATRRQIRRARKLPELLRDKGFRRVAVRPLVGHLIAAAALYAAVFVGVGLLSYGGWLPVDVAFQTLPDFTVLVLAGTAFLAVRGLGWFALAASRTRRPAARPSRPAQTPPARAVGEAHPVR
ncbi:serine hydrolase [Amycolatopsis sp. Poz14]|uniref:serine hydrolase domain-containing protein n=1 Tax=Amycolatopsis sp. Poz14 TaxID=1447705 RepID=UPI001EE8FA47|nr:serine hydrolase domain-containing protein [Amycolatopsis sp. Poz14]MCG3756880.1 beta-lactamase family protein [Amycolatopsis sp. Poz14]